MKALKYLGLSALAAAVLLIASPSDLSASTTQVGQQATEQLTHGGWHGGGGGWHGGRGWGGGGGGWYGGRGWGGGGWGGGLYVNPFYGTVGVGYTPYYNSYYYPSYYNSGYYYYR